jgi:hypothetical protein
MSFEHHHPNREVDRNLTRARDLRSAHLFACLATVAGTVRRAFRVRRDASVPTGLELRVPPIGRQPI